MPFPSKYGNDLLPYRSALKMPPPSAPFLELLQPPPSAPLLELLQPPPSAPLLELLQPPPSAPLLQPPPSAPLLQPPPSAPFLQPPPSAPLLELLQPPPSAPLLQPPPSAPLLELLQPPPSAPLLQPPPSAPLLIMTSGAPLLAHRPRRSLLYKALCFLLLFFQGGILDFYLILFTDLYWCSWIATDLVVICGWGVFFLRNARSQRERACGFHLKGSSSGCSLGEFTYAYLAWLIYGIACAPKVVVILETSILEQIALQVPCGVTGFKVTVLLSVPLLFCLISSIVVHVNGPSHHRSHSCFTTTCLDLLDSFTLLEMLLRGEVPSVYLKYTVISAYFVALGAPVVWLYELSAAELRCRWLWARFSTGLLVNAPLLVVRCFQVFVYRMPVSVFMFKNVFLLLCGLLELLEQCAALRGLPKRTGTSNPSQFSHCVSDSDMNPHGYVNTLAVTQS
ncbi:PREDICTED: cat eye syndrome critical region protein 6-like [Cyprinodon variegatus]|uniref:cat eye syndrome critical region protein 6-like n=1 Tax=Cyprinodon variegatus TaxID=28743 RepID=UPI000742A169|nr:PREDICTED: cat eye syndrome critical region protein 6-like [Cyprinodon variegatus]